MPDRLPHHAEAKDLISHLLVVNPEDRYTVDQALAHSWISKPSTELALVSLERNLILLKDFKANRYVSSAPRSASYGCVMSAESLLELFSCGVTVPS